VNDPPKNQPRVTDALGSKEYPGQHDHRESENLLDEGGHAIAVDGRLFQRSRQHATRCMDGTPETKVHMAPCQSPEINMVRTMFT
jgi:hypothetical protein